MKTNLKLFFLLLLIIKVNFCISQVIGKCVDESGAPIPFLNIAIKKTSLGTVTDENGIFTINEGLPNNNDSLVFTHIGYKMQTISANRRDTIKVIMFPSEYQLNEVNIRPSDYIYKKEKIVGTETSSDHVVLSFSSHNLGTEIGKVIEVKKGKRYKVEKINFHLSKFNYSKSTFRVNFYKINENNVIETVRENYNDIIKEVSGIGMVKIDVSNENLEFENDFLVSIEWIDFIEKERSDPNLEKNIFFSSTVFSGPFYLRNNNLLKWKKIEGKFNMGLGINLNVKY